MNYIPKSACNWLMIYSNILRQNIVEIITQNQSPMKTYTSFKTVFIFISWHQFTGKHFWDKLPKPITINRNRNNFY